MCLTRDGKPDFDKIQAFVAHGNQGIVYEANQWHTPMAALDQVLAFLSGAYSRSLSLPLFRMKMV